MVSHGARAARVGEAAARSPSRSSRTNGPRWSCCSPLLSAARRCEARGLDVKAQALLATIGQLQREENDPALKVLLFTEFVPTQQMLAEVLEQRGYPVVLLNGSMNLEERKSAKRAFANETQILISTDAGGEGLNLQFCHVIINYDLPWCPTTIWLRGRAVLVDRS